MKKDKCYILPSGLRIRAPKKPNSKTIAALEELFKVVKKHLDAIT